MICRTFLIGASMIAATIPASADGFYRGGGYKDATPDIFTVPSTISRANNQVGVSFVATDFYYKETVDGEPFDTEKNWVPGFGVSLSLMRNWFVDNLYFNARFARQNGSTDYVGAYWGQPFGSLVTQSSATVYDYDVRLGKGFFLQPDVMLTPFVGGGYHEWDRGVNAGEDYSHGYVGAGLLLQWSFMSRFVLSVDGFAGTTIDPQVVVASDSLAATTINSPFKAGTQVGVLEGSTLALGTSGIYKVGLSGDYAITRAIHMNAGVEWVGYGYGKSAPDPTGTYLEPHSETSNITVKVGVGYAFGDGFVPSK